MALHGQASSITAVDRDRGVLDKALGLGIVDEATSDLAETLSSTDLLILATPVKQITMILEWMSSYNGGKLAILDLGSTKKEICTLMSSLPERYEAIGGHPMCGREESGLGAAQSALYQNHPFVLCRTSRTSPYVEELALQIVHTIGAQPMFLSPDKHDETVATTSHLPYVTAMILMDVVSAVAQNNHYTWTVSATGLRDTSRLSGSNPQMMLDILLSNKEGVVKQLRAYRQSLAEFVPMLEQGDEQMLLKWLNEIQQNYWKYRRGENI